MVMVKTNENENVVFSGKALAEVQSDGVLCIFSKRKTKLLGAFAVGGWRFVTTGEKSDAKT